MQETFTSAIHAHKCLGCGPLRWARAKNPDSYVMVDMLLSTERLHKNPDDHMMVNMLSPTEWAHQYAERYRKSISASVALGYSTRKSNARLKAGALTVLQKAVLYKSWTCHQDCLDLWKVDMLPEKRDGFCQSKSQHAARKKVQSFSVVPGLASKQTLSRKQYQCPHSFFSLSQSAREARQCSKLREHVLYLDARN